MSWLPVVVPVLLSLPFLYVIERHNAHHNWLRQQRKAACDEMGAAYDQLVDSAEVVAEATRRLISQYGRYPQQLLLASDRDPDYVEAWRAYESAGLALGRARASYRKVAPKQHPAVALGASLNLANPPYNVHLLKESYATPDRLVAGQLLIHTEAFERLRRHRQEIRFRFDEDVRRHIVGTGVTVRDRLRRRWRRIAFKLRTSFRMHPADKRERAQKREAQRS